MAETRTTLEAVAWRALPDAFGQTDRVPFLLRKLTSGDDGERKEALAEAWYTLWHQGTVYACTPATVPFLVDVIVNTGVSERIRTEVGFLLREVARAQSFVLPEDPTTQWLARWWPDSGSPPRDLDVECRAAVAAQGERLGAALPSAGPALEAALVGVFGAVPEAVTADVHDRLTVLERLGDTLLAAAAGLVLILAAGHPAERDLRSRAELDGDVADWLGSISDYWPVDEQGSGLVSELCAKVADAHLARPNAE